MNIKKGDTVQIVTGKDRGKSGKVLKIFQKNNVLSIEGLNLYKKHKKPKKQGEKGEVVELPKAMHFSNVQIVCSNCKKPVRTGMRIEGTKKTRVCRKCNRAV